MRVILITSEERTMTNGELELNALQDNKSTYFKRSMCFATWQGSVNRTNRKIVKKCRARQKYLYKKTRSSSG